MTRTLAIQTLGRLGILLVAGCEEAPSEMDVVVAETGVVTDGPVTVGNGLSFDLELRVGSAPGPFEAPTDLEVVPDDASALRVEIVGPTSSGQGTTVRLTPLAARSGSVRFFADNAVEDPTFRYDAVEIDEAQITANVQGEPDSETTGDEMTAFVGSRIFFEAEYRSGGVSVLGRELLEVDAEASGTSFLDLSDASLPQLLDLGETAHDAVVRSPASGDIFTVHAVDVTAVWLTELLVNGAPFASEAPYEMTVGDEVRVDLVPSSRPGARIWGLSPTPPEWDIRGSSVVETGRDGNGVYLEAAMAGDTNVIFTYGAAQAAMELSVSN